jgi:CRISPR system Cascade subunit CasA
MPEMLFNLLTEPLITVLPTGGESATMMTLPAVLAALAAHDDIEFAALQPHQGHAWHAFLVQLAAIALDAAAIEAPPASADQWGAMLRALTQERDAAWSLVVPDLAQPAFMQPPVPEASLASWKNYALTADAIDLLQTAGNHDVKAERILRSTPEHWLYALITLQTMQGYSGRDNYGIARMNGGVGSRACVAAARDLAWHTRFCRDLQVLLGRRPALRERFDREAGLALLWTIPWDGNAQLTPAALNPYFIEVCRRIRLVMSDGAIAARGTTSKRERIAAKELKGNLGDPWVPIRKEDGAALTARNFAYDLVQRVVLGPDWEHSAASQVQPEDGDQPVVVLQVLARDQGKTAGFHQRLIPIPPKARLRLSTAQGRVQVGELARQRVDTVGEVARRLLRPALCCLLQGDPPRLDLRDDRAQPWLDDFDAQIDTVFFVRLFDDLDLDPPAARIAWLAVVLECARASLDDACRSAPMPAMRRWRASAAAERIFNSGSYRLRAAAGALATEEERDAGNH